ncbi:MAG: NYN domain-containing protein [Clostridia bacterium]|nr:NYN domain-containing protein [Clostridia bacterium]
MIFEKFFKRNDVHNENGIAPSSKPRAVAFVDFEHWYISLDKMYHVKPKIREWRDSLAEKYDVTEIMFFGDFSNQSLRNEISHIREVTNFIVDTQNTSPHHKKDFTDFIMLDHIYRKAISGDNVDAFIIFTGDGHFNSVVQFIVDRCNKEVGIYAVKNALSNQLRTSASWYEELPKEDYMAEYYEMILDNLKRIENSHRHARATFSKTVTMVAQRNNADEELVRTALEKLIQKGYILQKRERTRNNKMINVIRTDWEKLENDGMFPARH